MPDAGGGGEARSGGCRGEEGGGGGGGQGVSVASDGRAKGLQPKRAAEIWTSKHETSVQTSPFHPRGRPRPTVSIPHIEEAGVSAPDMLIFDSLYVGTSDGVLRGVTSGQVLLPSRRVVRSRN